MDVRHRTLSSFGGRGRRRGRCAGVLDRSLPGWMLGRRGRRAMARRSDLVMLVQAGVFGCEPGIAIEE
jgi:hypothetical protein